MIGCVADASALLKLVIDEPDAALAVAYFAREYPGAPGIAVAEVANVLRRLVKSRERSAARARESLDTIIASISILPETDEESNLTLDLAISLDHSAQDCRYLAAAIAAKVPLVTADENFARKARTAGHDARIVSELPAR
jgi:predicted nucleic acid-binding protein